MPNATIALTVLPRGATADGRCSLAVFVTFRLRGADVLGAFPDVRRWTDHVAQGVRLTLEAGGTTTDVTTDPAPLRADLWDAMFTDDTPVVPDQTKDDTDAGWGEQQNLSAHDRWLFEQRPPHWGKD